MDQGKELDQLTLDELKQFSELIKADIFGYLTVEQMIDRRQSLGGTAMKNVAQAIVDARKALAGDS